MGIENREQVVILQKDNRLCPASWQVQQERDVVLWAKTEGHLGILTKTERPVVVERYLSQQGVVVSFGLSAQKSNENGTQITRGALYLDNRRAIAKLVRANKGEEPIKPSGGKALEIDIGRMKEMLDEGWLEGDVARELGCSKTTLVRRIRCYRDELKLNIKRGKPRKNTQVA